MAASKKKKTPKKIFEPQKGIRQREDPDSYYDKNPSWVFSNSDSRCWTYNRETLWDDIIPKLKSFETMKWRDILLVAKKHNHTIEIECLNKCARDRLDELYIEQEALVSLDLEGQCRLYGYIVDGVFNIIWYDDNHGDNETCVCRSRKKHT